MRLGGLAIAAAIALLLAFTSRVQADDSPLQASLSCQPAAGPGRILCELTTHAAQGKLVWSDALVVRAPAFARPLRSRFLAQLGGAAAAGGAWAKLALVASEPGEGKLELLARGVVCHDGPAGEWCAPVRTRVTVDVRVGSANSHEP
ncbi:MAG TPA: hypothetical protein VGC79_17725 [Polyangiaceae bacterium]